jgi:hypothetical protein
MELEAYDTLLMGFWPQTRQLLEVRGMQAYDSINGEEFRGEDHYIGPQSQRPRCMYYVEQDCHVGDFVLVRPAQDSPAPIWVGQALSNPVLMVGDFNYQQIQVQWYKPCTRRGSESNPYQNWNIVPHFKWECDSRYVVQWTNMKSILTSWKSRRLTQTEVVIIPKNQITTALENIASSITIIPNAPAEASDSDSD